MLHGKLRRQVRDARKQTARLVVRQQEAIRQAHCVMEDIQTCSDDLLKLQGETTQLMDTLSLVLSETTDEGT